MRFTIFGASGFIGRHLAHSLTNAGFRVMTPLRPIEPLPAEDLGHVIYAIGLTADYRQRTPETIEAHAHLLARLLRVARFDSWLYLSSTRVYSQLPSDRLATEEGALTISPTKDSIYELSKLLGESVCMAHSSPAVRIARLSNVIGPNQNPDSFLGSIVGDLVRQGSASVAESRDSCKDYIDIDDASKLIIKIATSGCQRIYNVASGNRTSHEEVAQHLERLTKGRVAFQEPGVQRIPPKISVSRAEEEFDFCPSNLSETMSRIHL